MLLIISDLHLTDGTSGATISSGAFHLLAERVQDLATRASFRTNGSYRPIEQIDMILLGDVLDVIRSSQWLATDVRPWDDVQSPATVETVSRITQDILDQNDASFTVLRALAHEGVVQIPPANQMGRPVATAPGIPVPVRIHYLVGNHDWFYHLEGPGYNTIRQQVVHRLGLANRAEMPFAHDPAEDQTILAAMRRHQVFARHGDIYDPFNFEGDRDASSIGDAIVIELLNRFSAQVESELGTDLPIATIHGLREIDNIRPLMLVPVWIDGLLERTCSFPAMRKKVKMIWDGLADRFLELSFIQARDTWCPVDLVDGLQKALKFSQRLSVDWASWLSQWMLRMRGASHESYYQHALTERDFRNRRAKHIVYGHTHQPETYPLDASYAEGNVLNQVYFNSGTWRRVHRQTLLAPGEHEFIASDTMTYLAFFQENERRGRPYETWTGSLGVDTVDAPIYRVDQGGPQHAFGQSISASGVPVVGPHFTAAPVHSPIVPRRRV